MAGVSKIFTALCVLLVVSCSSTSPDFTAYKDDTIFEGHGGVVRSVNGIEIWTEGSPDRKFQIIGAVALKEGTALQLPGPLNQLAQLGQLAESSPEAHLASEARAHGGDAVIIIQTSQRQEGFFYSENETSVNAAAGGAAESPGGSASPKHGHSTRAYIIKYLDAGS